MKIEFIFKWFDFWIGLFWDSKKGYLYVLPLPMCGFILKFRTFNAWMEELMQIAYRWDGRQYPIGSKWAVDYWRQRYNSGMTPQQTWDEYTTDVR